MSPEALAVQQKLLSLDLETPYQDNQLSTQDKYRKIKVLMTEMLTTLGLDLEDDSLAETPHRLAKMYSQEIFAGLDYNNFPTLCLLDNKMQLDEMVKVKDISFTSCCEHHFVNIDGIAKVAYLPNKKIIGLSKINRIVRFFCAKTSGTRTAYPANFSSTPNPARNKKCSRKP